jgi:Flp pilus assembly protein TadD
MGVGLLWSREIDSALEAAARCIALKPSSADARVLKAHIQIFSGLAADAVETLESYMQLDPFYPEIALQFLAEAQVSLGRFDLAAETLRKRLVRNPASATAYALLASCCGHLGRTEEGRAAWTQALKIDPDYSIEHRRHVMPYKNPADFELRVEGLRRLGLAV